MSTARKKVRTEESPPASEPAAEMAPEVTRLDRRICVGPTPNPQNGAHDNLPSASVSPSPPAHMIIKRSLSPDGRIDSISVQIELVISDEPASEIKTKAGRALALQTEIVRDYIQSQEPSVPGPPAKSVASQPSSGQPQGTPAELLSIGSMDGKWGHRYFLNVKVNGQTAKLFGSPKQLVFQLAKVGQLLPPEAISDGLKLNLACRAVTETSKDGRYLNVVQLYPAE